jgi:Family of unknown function (DUF6314)
MSYFKLKDLLGWWRLDRRVERFDGSLLGTMVGMAHFGPTIDQRLLYRERVVHKPFGAPPLVARQSYLYSLFDNQLRIYFPDGRLFVDLRAMGEETGWGSHQCGQDQYRVRFLLLQKQWLQQEIEVVGPQKQYRTRTAWTKR